MICCIGLTGYTDKGVYLENTHPKGIKQFKIAFEVIRVYIDFLLQIFKKIHIKSVSGNHFWFGDWVLFKNLASWYRLDERIDFDVSDGRWLTFKILNSMVVMEHGASHYAKNMVPPNMDKLKQYVNTLLLEYPKLLDRNK